MWRHFMSRDCLLLRATALYKVKRTGHSSFWHFTGTCRWLPVKLRHFQGPSGPSGHMMTFPVMWLPPASYSLDAQYKRVFGLLQQTISDFRPNDITSCHQTSSDIISIHVAVSYCELQPWRKWNAQYTRLSPSTATSRWLPSNDVTSESLPITWGHVTFSATWLPPPASYSLVGIEMYSIRKFSAFYSHFQVTSGQMTSLSVTSGHLRSCDVISCHVTASYCELQPCRKWNVQNMWVFGLPPRLPGDFRSNDVTSKSLSVTWDHVTPFSVTWLPPTASYRLVGSEM